MKKGPVNTKTTQIVITKSSSVAIQPKNTAFDAKHYVKGHIALEDVQFAKEAFDIFDSDRSGSIDCKGTSKIT
jgi:hypothetical protein